jgi:hypothetical protein
VTDSVVQDGVLQNTVAMSEDKLTSQQRSTRVGRR